MLFLYCDESNLEERSGDFLIYAGVVIDSDHAHQLSERIEALRSRYNVPQEFALKFNPGPDELSHPEFIALKQAVIEAAFTHGSKFLVYLVLHDIATNADEARLNGINTVCYHFDCLLNWERQVGLVLVDQFNDTGNQINAHLTGKFRVGLTGMPYSQTLRMEKILGFHYSKISQSNFPSIADIAIGSLRFAVNAFTRNEVEKLPTARRLLNLLSPLFVRRDEKVAEISLFMSPKTVLIDRYRQKYLDLQSFFLECGLPMEQIIGARR